MGALLNYLSDTSVAPLQKDLVEVCLCVHVCVCVYAYCPLSNYVCYMFLFEKILRFDL